MKKAFTLIELIFVIVIIGVLSAVAVPKFVGLKESAEVNSVLKVANDAIASIPSIYIGKVDLNNEDKENIKITDLVEIKGKGWVPSSGGKSYCYFTEVKSENTCNDLGAGKDGALTGGAGAVTLTLDTENRKLYTKFDCKAISTKDKSKIACVINLGKTAPTDAKTINAIDDTISF